LLWGEYGDASVQVEEVGRFEGETHRPFTRSITTVEKRHGGETKAVVGESVDMDDGREIERFFQFDFHSFTQCKLKGWKVFFVCSEELLEQDLGLLHCLENSHKTGVAEIFPSQGHRADDLVGSHGIGNEITVLMIVADKGPKKIFIGPANLGCGHGTETLQEFARLQEFSARSLRELETLRGFDFVKAFEEVVISGRFGMGKDIVASHPAEKDESDQKKDKHRPSKEAVGCIGTTALSAITVDSVISFS